MAEKAAQSAGLDEMAVAGANRIPVDAAGQDPAAPTSLKRIINANDHRALRHEPATRSSSSLWDRSRPDQTARLRKR